jgi:hypothetical protein
MARDYLPYATLTPPGSGTLGGPYFAVLLETDLRVFFDFESCPQGKEQRDTPPYRRCLGELPDRERDHRVSGHGPA